MVFPMKMMRFKIFSLIGLMIVLAGCQPGEDGWFRNLSSFHISVDKREDLIVRYVSDPELNQYLELFPLVPGTRWTYPQNLPYNGIFTCYHLETQIVNGSADRVFCEGLGFTARSYHYQASQYGHWYELIDVLFPWVQDD